MLPYMNKEGKGFYRYSLIAKITKIFNDNNFSKVQRICTFIAQENFPNPFPPLRDFTRKLGQPPSLIFIARYLNAPLYNKMLRE